MAFDDEDDVAWEAYRRLLGIEGMQEAFPNEWIAVGADGLVLAETREPLHHADPGALLRAVDRSGLRASDLLLYFVNVPRIVTGSDDLRR